MVEIVRTTEFGGLEKGERSVKARAAQVARDESQEKQRVPADDERRGNRRLVHVLERHPEAQQRPVFFSLVFDAVERVTACIRASILERLFNRLLSI